MNVGSATSLDALVQLGLQAEQRPARPATTPAHAPAAAAAARDADGDNDGGRLGTQLNVKA